VLVFPELCHGCGGCSIVCAPHAITETEHRTGLVKIGVSAGFDLIYGELSIGEAKAPPVIKEVKRHIINGAVNIIDAPPGTSCPVVESVKHTDFVILVTEPTPFGLNDLMLAVEMVRKLELPFGVIINRCDIGDERVDDFCQEQQIDVLMTIPQSRELAIAYSEGKLIIETLPKYRQKFLDLYHSIQTVVAE
jgi:MinD superfamily P-loop ATPase